MKVGRAFYLEDKHLPWFKGGKCPDLKMGDHKETDFLAVKMLTWWKTDFEDVLGKLGEVIWWRWEGFFLYSKKFRFDEVSKKKKKTTTGKLHGKNDFMTAM